MNEFYDYTRTRVKDEKLLEILDELWSDKDLTSDKVYTRYFEFLEKN